MRLIVQIDGVSENEPLHPTDVARVLGTTEITLRRWRQLRRGPAYILVKNRVRYTPLAIAAWIANDLPWARNTNDGRKAAA